MPEKKHSAIGPSGAYRWMNCPASVRAESTYPSDAGRNVYADEGSAAHALADLCLRGGPDAEYHLDHWYDPVLGQFNEKSARASDIHVDEEMVEHVQGYVDSCFKMVGKGDQVFIEHTIDLSSVHPDMFGTLDFGIYKRKERTLHVKDLKYGAGRPVEIDDNPQLKSYALGLVLEVSRKYPIENVVTEIYQPRARHSQGPVRVADYEPFDLLEFAGDLRKAAHATQGDNPRFKAGPWCEFCRHRALCQTAKEHALEIAGYVFDDEDLVALGEALDAVDVVEGWARAVRALATQYAKQRKAPEGWEIGQGRSLRVWNINAEKLANILSKRFALDKNAIYTLPEIKSPAQIEKLIGMKRKGEIEKYWTQPPGAPVLVRKGKGKRETDPSQVFDDEDGLL